MKTELQNIRNTTINTVFGLMALIAVTLNNPQGADLIDAGIFALTGGANPIVYISK